MKEYIPLVVKRKAKPFQVDLINDVLSHKMTFILGSRQIGKSWTLAVIALTLASGIRLKDGTAIKAHDVLIVSKSLMTAKNIIAMINKHLSAAERVEGKRLRDPIRGGIQEVVLANGVTIKAMPGTARTLQGFTGSVIVDEVSANDSDPEEMLAQSLALTSSHDHYRLIFASNADIEGSFTHKFLFDTDFSWRSRRHGWSIKDIRLADVYPDGLPDRYLQLKRTMSEKQWKRWYENQFLGAGLGILDPAQFSVRPPEDRGSLIIGVDPGFSATGNPTGVVVLRVGQQLSVLESHHWQGVPMETQHARIKALRQRYRGATLYIDQGVQGAYLADLCARDGATERVSVTQTARETAWHTLENLMTSDQINWDSPNSPVVQDLLHVVWDDRGRLHLPEYPHADGTPGRIHCDAADALLLTMGAVAKKIGRAPGVATPIHYAAPKGMTLGAR